MGALRIAALIFATLIGSLLFGLALAGAGILVSFLVNGTGSLFSRLQDLHVPGSLREVAVGTAVLVALVGLIWTFVKVTASVFT
jgi:hypothetical protein